MATKKKPKSAPQGNQQDNILQSIEAQWKSIIENTPDHILTLDKSLRIEFANHPSPGLTLKELIGTPIYTFLEKEIQAEIKKTLKSVLKTGQPATYETEYKTPGGEIIHYESLVAPRKLNDEIVGLTLIARDITDRKKAENALRESEERFRFLSQSSNEGVFLLEEGRILDTNLRGAELFGYSPEEMIGISVLDLTAPESREKLISHVQSGYDQPYEAVGQKKDGQTFLGEIQGKNISYLGRPMRATVIRDVTESKKTEEDLRESEEKYRSILETMEEGYFEVDMDGNFTFVNDTIANTIGYPKDQMMDMNYTEYLDTQNARKVFKAFNQVYATGEPLKIFNWEITTQKGSKVSVETSITLMKDRNGEPVGFRGIVRDITERKQSENLQNAIYDIADAADRVKNLDELFQRIHLIIQNVMPAGNFFIALYHGDENLISFPYYVDEMDPPPTPEKLGENLTSYILKTGKSLLCNTTKHEELERLGEVKLAGTPSPIWLGVPLIIEGNAIGAMTVQHYSDPKAYGLREQRILEFVSSQIARAIDHLQAEEDLRESEEQYRSILENIEEGYFEVDLDGNFTFFNESLRKMIGFSSDEIIGMNYVRFVDEDNAEKVFRGFNHIFNTGEVNPGLDWEITTKAGTKTYIEASVSLILDGQNEPIGFRGIVRDITERLKAAEALRKSEAMLAEAQRIAHLAHWDNDLISGETFWSDELFRIYKLQKEHTPPFNNLDDFKNLIHPDDREATSQMVEAAMKGEGEYKIDRRIICGDGEVRWVHIEGVVQFDDDRKPIRLFGTTQDITDRKQTEKALRDSEERYRRLIELNPAGIGVHSEGIIQFVNPSCLKLLGAEKEEDLIGKPILDIVHPDYRELVIERVKLAYENGVIGDPIEEKFVKLNVEEIDVEVTSIPLTYMDKPATQVVFWDITERIKSAKALKESEERLRTLSEATFEGVGISEKGRFIDGNEQLASILGYELDEMLGMEVGKAVAPQDIEFVREKILGGIQEPYEHRALKKDGSIIFVEVRPRMMEIEGREVRVTAIRDITERKQAEEEIRNLNEELEKRVKERTAELEAFSYSVSHDLRAPLRAINGFSQVILEEYSQILGDEGLDYLERIMAGSVKMDELIDDLLTLSHLGQRDLNLQSFDITVLVKEISNNLKESEKRRNIDINILDCPKVKADKPLLELMLTNLLANSLKFTQGRDPARIEFGCLTDQEEPIYYLKDDGIGFDMSISDKLFSPFQRLHPDLDYEGTGIGLAIVQRIAQRHGGRVWVEAEEDKGATFFFSL